MALVPFWPSPPGKISVPVLARQVGFLRSWSSHATFSQRSDVSEAQARIFQNI
jgi:hypothetical protein